MQELPATAMGRIPVMAIRPTPATTHRSRTPATPHLTAAPTATTHLTATIGSPIPASMEGGVIISGGWPCGRWSPATPGGAGDKPRPATPDGHDGINTLRR